MPKKSPILTSSFRYCAFLTVTALAVSAPAPRAAATVAPALEASRQVEAAYRIYVHGFNVAHVLVKYRLTPIHYNISTDVDASGLISLFLRMKIQSAAEGAFSTDWVAPHRFESGGYSRGAERHILLTYQDGQPDIADLTPREADRETVPKQALKGTLDTLSAVAMLQHRMLMTQTCNGAANVFDGLRLTEMQVKGPIMADVPKGNRQRYAGKMLRCDFIGRQIAGFMRETPNRALFSAPYPGAAWFDTGLAAPLIVVRFEFHHPKLGKIIAVLDHYSTS
ncbi:hypothetical protein CGLAMM_07490 [Acetobacteraceae bacterium EV16G]|uniref:DUF3108 domain-containing protein n=1 Tax=Sorlinia euscelidii TaxID=3081148 RepID=A0ABU7U4A1_9PROT